MGFNHREIEAKWQKYWEDNQTFKTDVWDFSKPKFYALEWVYTLVTQKAIPPLISFVV